MKDIIIVGTGKASFLHSYSYEKFVEIGNVYFVDIVDKVKDNNVKTKTIYRTIQEVIVCNNLNTENVIVDICTPKSVFMEIIKKCKQLGIKNIIVEKPFIVEETFFERNADLNISMVHNYNYSKIILKLKEILKLENLEIKAIYTNFSKNRIEESFKGRGMNKVVTRNIEHDIPHQVYMVQNILNSNKSTQLVFKEEKGMQKENEILEKHGYSKIISRNDNVLIVHESDFSTNTVIREVIIVCENDITLQGEFLVYDKNLVKIRDGKVKKFKNNVLIEDITIDFDDNMYECLSRKYKFFEDKNSLDVNKKEILDFSREMNMYMNS